MARQRELWRVRYAILRLAGMGNAGFELRRLTQSPHWPSLGSALISLLINLATQVSNVFLPLFAEQLGGSKLDIGILGGVNGAAYAFSTWFFGRQSDLKGRLFFIRLSLGLAIPAVGAQAVATSIPVLILARAIVGFCLGMPAGILMAYHFEVGGRTGRFASLSSAGWLSGSLIAAVLQGYQALFILGAAACGLALLVSLSLREPERRAMAGSAPPVTTDIARRNIGVYLPFFLRQLGAHMVWVVFPLFLVTLGANKAWIAIISAINTGGQVVAMPFIDRLRASRIFPLGLLLSSLAFIAYSGLNSYFQVIPVHALIAVAWSFLYVGALMLLLKQNEEKATATGLLYTSINLSAAVGPFLGGMVAQSLGYRPLMYFGSGLCLAGFVVRLASTKAREAFAKTKSIL